MPRGCASVAKLVTYVSLPVPGATVNRAILLVVRSVEYKNLPLGVIWMSAAQTFGFSSFGGAAAGVGAAPTGACGVPQARPTSAGTELMLSTRVNVPLPESTAYCVTCPDNSLST